MITSDDISKAFNEAGIDTPELLAAFLKPASINAQLAAYDGKLADIAAQRTKANSDFQQQTEDVLAAKAEALKKLQSS